MRCIYLIYLCALLLGPHFFYVFVGLCAGLVSLITYTFVCYCLRFLASQAFRSADDGKCAAPPTRTQRRAYVLRVRRFEDRCIRRTGKLARRMRWECLGSDEKKQAQKYLHEKSTIDMRSEKTFHIIKISGVAVEPRGMHGEFEKLQAR